MSHIGMMRKIFITVKTYPTLSKKYDELVCTAGILDDGKWARVYPLPFRKLDYDNRYQKYQWMELPLVKNESDPRPESYRVVDMDQVRLVGEPVGTRQEWIERKDILFKNNTIYSDLAELIEKANKNELSIAIFKPSEIVDLVVEAVDREWSKESLQLLKAKPRQASYPCFRLKKSSGKNFSLLINCRTSFPINFVMPGARQAH